MDSVYNKIRGCSTILLNESLLQIKKLYNMQALVEFKSVSKSFDNSILVENISFKLNRGEITTLVGQNGVGKTTLIKFILGLERYDSGEVIVANNIRIGYVPQKLDFNFNMPLTSEGLINILSPNGLDKNFFEYSQLIDYESIKKKIFLKFLVDSYKN